MTIRDTEPTAGGTGDSAAYPIVAALLTGRPFDLDVIDRSRFSPPLHELLDALQPHIGDRDGCLATFTAWRQHQPGGGEDVALGVLRCAPGEDWAAASGPRFKLYSLAELDALPTPEFLIDGILIRSSVAAIVGEQESFKSFISVDMSLCIAAGIPWQGNNATKTPVVYVSGEGASGIAMRSRAWRIAHRMTNVPGFYAINEPVQLLQRKEVDGLLTSLSTAKVQPGLLVLDTLARSIVGADENSAKDMGLAIDACDRIKRETDSTILLVHHQARAGNIRGSTALPGGLDTQIDAKRDGDLLTLSCGKQKDFDHFPTIRLERNVVELPDGTSSLVFTETTKEAASAISQSNQRVLEVLRETFGNEGTTASTLIRVCGESGIPERTAWRALKELEEHGKVAKDGDRRGARYKVV